MDSRAQAVSERPIPTVLDRVARELKATRGNVILGVLSAAGSEVSIDNLLAYLARRGVRLSHAEAKELYADCILALGDDPVVYDA